MNMWSVQIAGLEAMRQANRMANPMHPKQADGLSAGIQRTKALMGQNEETVIAALSNGASYMITELVEITGISRNTISKILRRIKGRGGAEKFRRSSTEKYLRWKLIK